MGEIKYIKKIKIKMNFFSVKGNLTEMPTR